MEPSAPPRAPGGRRNGRQARNAQELRAYARDRLIESRLTPNAISMVGLVGNLVAAVAGHPAPLLPRRRRLHPRLGDGHARRPLLADVGQGDALRRLPRLDPGPDRGGDRARRRRRLLRRHRRRLRRRDVRGRRARLADGLLHARPGRGARGRVQGRVGDAAGQGGAYFRSAWSSPRAPVSAISNCWRRRST